MKALESAYRFRGARVTRLSLDEAPSRDILLLFPGFPGYPLPAGALSGPPKLRVAAALAALSVGDMDAHLPGYPGLESGAFRFQEALDGGVELALSLARVHRRVHVGGHSWGAFVAFNAHRALGAGAGRLALLSGLLDLPDEAAVRAFLPYYLHHFPQVLGSGERALERAARDLDLARRGANPMTLARPMPADGLLVAHGRRDEEVSIELSRRFHARAGGRLLELDADHSLAGRLPAVAEAFARFLKT